MKKNINQKRLQPLPFGIASAVFAILLLFVIIYFGLTANSRGPIEILLALFLGSFFIFVQAMLRRSR